MGYDRIMARVGCVSPSHQGAVKRPSASPVLSDGAGDEIFVQMRVLVRVSLDRTNLW